MRQHGFLALATVIALGAAGTTQAASLPHPGPIVMQDGVYDNIVETSVTDPLPLFGAPIAGAGNVLTFPLSGYTASASNDASDLTAGVLELTLDAHPGKFIKTVSLFETGTYDITGTGSVSAFGALTVRYLDELTQQIVTLADPIHLVVSPQENPDGAFPAQGPESGDWLGAALIDFEDLGIWTPHVLIALDNNLAASAPPGGTSTITKDSLTVNSTFIPEPASLAMIGAGVLLMTRRTP